MKAFFGLNLRDSDFSYHPHGHSLYSWAYPSAHSQDAACLALAARKRVHIVQLLPALPHGAGQLGENEGAALLEAQHRVASMNSHSI